MHAGANREGEPMKFEIIDDWTFKITFADPYGGFILRLAITGWVGYTDFLNPSHILKKYHIDHATDADKEEWPALIEQWGIIDDGDRTWVSLLNHLWIRNWDVGRRRAIGYPTLNPWLLTEATESVYTFVRNPYYFKVDAEGQQLPYIDILESTIVSDIEMVQLKAFAGEVDFMRESASLVNLPLYIENEEAGGYKTLMFNMHVNPTVLFLNLTFGDDPGYTEMVMDKRFRRGLMHAIDRDEIIDSIYYGFADPNSYQTATYDPAKAEELFAEMGMVKGSDGFYLQPDGKPFQILLEHGAEAPDILPFTELVAQFWREAGINAQGRRLESALVGQRQAANELQTRVLWDVFPLWYWGDAGYSMWGRLWDVHRTNTTTITITHEDGTVETQDVRGIAPPPDVQEFYDLFASIHIVPVTEAFGVFNQVKKSMDENVWFISPLENVKQPMIFNAKLRNISDQGFAIGVNFSAEQMWYAD